MGLETTIDEDGVALVRLALGRGNAIGPAFLESVGKALEDLAGPGVARSVVLTGDGKTFSSGLDLAYAHALEGDAFAGFVDAFDGFFERTLAFPRPLVAAIDGHAVAGGCILAMCADLRIAAQGTYGIGINEVLLGIPFPSAALEIARRALPGPMQPLAFLAGQRFTPDAALAGGLVHRVVPAADLLAEARAAARAFTAAGAEATSHVKADLLAPVLDRIEAHRAARRQRFIDAWTAADARRRRQELLDEMAKRRAAAATRAGTARS